MTNMGRLGWAAGLLTAAMVGTGCQGVRCHTNTSMGMPAETTKIERRVDFGWPEVHVVAPANLAQVSPPILLLHEVTGFSPPCLALAERLAASGFTVYIPSLFPGDQKQSAFAIRRRLVSVSLSPRWHTLVGSKTPAVLGELRPIARRISNEHEGASVGVIGMCLTGAWPLAFLGEPPVRIAALCQPTVPFLPITTGRKADLGLSKEDLESAENRIRQERLTVLGFRFCSDPLSTAERLRTVIDLCGARGRFVGRTICSRQCSPPIGEKAHSTLCQDYSDEPGHPTREVYELIEAEFTAALAPR